jgi:hypothetical protein
LAFVGMRRVRLGKVNRPQEPAMFASHRSTIHLPHRRPVRTHDSSRAVRYLLPASHQRAAVTARHLLAMRARTLNIGVGLYGIVVLVALACALAFVDSASQSVVQALGATNPWPLLSMSIGG